MSDLGQDLSRAYLGDFDLLTTESGERDVCAKPISAQISTQISTMALTSDLEVLRHFLMR